MATIRKAVAAKPAAKVSTAKKPTARSAAKPAASANSQKSDFDAIQRKARALGAKLTPADFDKDGNPVGAWAAMLAELDAWAKKYKVKFRTTEVVTPAGEPGTPTPRTRGTCLGTMSTTERTDWVGGGHITIKTTCTLRRQTILTGRCVYSCVGEILGFSTS